MKQTVLLLSLGRNYSGYGNFGCAHLVSIGSWVRANTGAEVEIVDLDCEKYVSDPCPQRIFDRRYAVVGISCYSSYQYLEASALGREIRRRNPAAVLVAGGYHPSARPSDFVRLPESQTIEAPVFDHVVVGEGEIPFGRIVSTALRGERLAAPVLGPEPVDDLDQLPPMDWSLLDRYRPMAQRTRGQVALWLSRGCPFTCSFCMERCKGEARWRAWSPSRAEEELKRLNAWLDLRGWKLFIADALFGLRPDWRHEMLERITALALPVDKVWALSRADILAKGDLAQFHKANFGLGFGMESGSPEMLRIMSKSSDPQAFLARLGEFAREASAIGLPWGANIVAGHPGETRQSMRETAEFCRRLFSTLRPLTGSLSVDPYRFYPGSPVDRDLDRYVTRFGLRVYRPRWWEYSEQSFCSEWVDPSATLDYRSRERLTAETIGPILEMIAARFDYHGPARDYFMRSVEHARQLFHPPARLRVLADYHLWRGLTGGGNGRLAGDAEARRLLREARRASVTDVMRRRCPSAPGSVVSALVDERRERYVPASHAAVAWQDCPILLDVAGAGDAVATVSALHAYLIAFTLLGLRTGDRLLDVGGGTGYGAGAAARVVGRTGHVTTLEIDPGLSRQARRNLRHRPNVTVIQGDGRVPPCGVAFRKVLFGFALPAIPAAYVDALPEKGVIVAPVGDADGQVLTRVVRRNGRPVVSCHGPVRYVLARSVETSL